MTSTRKIDGVAAKGGGRGSLGRLTTARIPPRPALFDMILVPTDFSAESHEVFEQALQLAEQFNGSVHLLHVVDKRKLAALERLALLPDDPSLIATVEKKLVGFARKCGHPVVPVFPLVSLGEAWREIINAARSCEATLIMLPTHGYKGLQHVMLGSVAERVVRSAPCPVMVVRPTNKLRTNGG